MRPVKLHLLVIRIPTRVGGGSGGASGTGRDGTRPGNETQPCKISLRHSCDVSISRRERKRGYVTATLRAGVNLLKGIDHSDPRSDAKRRKMLCHNKLYFVQFELITPFLASSCVTPNIFSVNYARSHFCFTCQ